VKRAFLRNEDSRRNFLAELRTWIDLPEHPHLVACRFFRTVGDEVVIFAEYVEGGSLADWIRERRLKRGGASIQWIHGPFRSPNKLGPPFELGANVW
jgi:hypothetical protein